MVRVGSGGYGASVRPPVAQNASPLSLVGNQGRTYGRLLLKETDAQENSVIWTNQLTADLLACSKIPIFLATRDQVNFNERKDSSCTCFNYTASV